MKRDKVLILDKSAFHGTALSKLIKLAKCQCIILPHALCVECVISEKGNPPRDSKDPICLMQKLIDLVKSGAHLGKSPGKIVEEEKSQNAAIKSLIDPEETKKMRESILDTEPDLEKAREECNSAFKPIMDSVGQWVDKYYKNIVKKELEKGFREEVGKGNLVGRLEKWLQSIDKCKDDISNNFLGNSISSDRWEWQLLRLSLAWGIELASKRNESGPSFKNYDISNDIFDIHYVSHLSQASGIIAGDKNLVQPLAKSAFPMKDVFNNIDDIPCKY